MIVIILVQCSTKWLVMLLQTYGGWSWIFEISYFWTVDGRFKDVDDHRSYTNIRKRPSIAKQKTLGLDDVTECEVVQQNIGVRFIGWENIQMYQRMSTFLMLLRSFNVYLSTHVCMKKKMLGWLFNNVLLFDRNSFIQRNSCRW